MQTRGFLSPETAAEARAYYEEVGPAAQTVVRETARSMAFDKAEYDERVTGEVVATARDALFASLLAVHVGTREEFDDWLAARDDYDVIENGSDSVDNVVWHAAPFAETVVAATFQSEADAAVATLRRVAHGRLYQSAVADGDSGSDSGSGSTASSGGDSDADSGDE